MLSSITGSQRTIAPILSVSVVLGIAVGVLWHSDQTNADSSPATTTVMRTASPAALARSTGLDDTGCPSVPRTLCDPDGDMCTYDPPAGDNPCPLAIGSPCLFGAECEITDENICWTLVSGPFRSAFCYSPTGGTSATCVRDVVPCIWINGNGCCTTHKYSTGYCTCTCEATRFFGWGERCVCPPPG